MTTRGLGQGARRRFQYGLPMVSFQSKKMAAPRRAAKLRYKNRRIQSGFTRTGGFYGRYRGDAPEMKFLDTPINLTYDTTAECSTTGATGNIHIVPQDDTQSGRDGRQIVIKSIQLRGTNIFVPGGSASATTNYFLWLILDSQCNGANPAITDVFTSNVAHSCMLNLANDRRFRIIKKWSWNGTSTAGVTTAYNSISNRVSWYKRCNIPITYDATAASGVITTTRQNNIFMAFGTDGNSDDIVTLNGTVRIRFTG